MGLQPAVAVQIYYIKFYLNLSMFEIKKYNFLGTNQEWNDALDSIRVFTKLLPF